MHHRIYGVCKFWCLYQSIMYAKLTLARLHKNALRFLPAHWIAFSSLQFSLCWVTSAFMMSAEDDQKLRRRARNHRYRQDKGKEPQQQAQIAASTAKYRRGKAKDPDHQARIGSFKCEVSEGQSERAWTTGSNRSFNCEVSEGQSERAWTTGSNRSFHCQIPAGKVQGAWSTGSYGSFGCKVPCRSGSHGRKQEENQGFARGLHELIPKTIGNRKRDCAWGCASVAPGLG